MARAKQRSWRWPWERLRPPSVMIERRDLKGLMFWLPDGEPGSTGDEDEVSPFACPLPSACSSRDIGAETRWTRSNASRSSSSVCSSKASRLLRTVPENRTGSWGMIARRDRKALSFIFETSRPSMWMLPCRASRNRNSARVNELLPAPVLPTTPILSLGATLKVTPLRTGGRSGA